MSTIHIKCDQTLHIAAKVKALNEGKSLNQYLQDLIEKDVLKEEIEAAERVLAEYEPAPGIHGVSVVEVEPDAGTVTDFTDSKGSTVTYDTLANVRGGERITVNEAKVCKHGADPSFCKYAKPGKVCK